MSIDIQTTGVPADIKADNEAVFAAFLAGKKADPEIVARVHARAEKIRDEVFRKHGYLDIAVPFIRELRDAEPVCPRQFTPVK